MRKTSPIVNWIAEKMAVPKTKKAIKKKLLAKELVDPQVTVLIRMKVFYFAVEIDGLTKLTLFSFLDVQQTQT